MTIEQQTVFSLPYGHPARSGVLSLWAGFGMMATLFASPVSAQTQGWFPWQPDTAFTGTSVADLSSMNHKPAGKLGAVKSQGDKFVYGDGSTALFWGTNLQSSACFPDKAKASQVAKDLARMGYNLVRFHHLDGSWVKPYPFADPSSTRKLSPESVDRFDFFVAELKKNGIYVFINLLSERPVLGKDFEGHGDPGGLRGFKLSGYWASHPITLQKEYITQLLGHVNPYLGTETLKDPAVAMIGLINEVSLMEYGGQIGGEYQVELNQKWKDFCSSQGLACPGGDANDLAKNNNQIFKRFLSWQQGAYSKMMRDWLKGQGFGGVVSATAMHGGSQGGVGNILGNADGDYIIRHFYWDHPQWGDSSMTNKSMITEVNSKGPGGDWHSIPLNYVAPTQVVNMPLIVAEWGFLWPSERAVEGPLLMAAFGSLQGWDAPVHYGYSSDEKFMIWSMWGFFETCSRPHILAANVLAAKLFRRGDVPQAPNGFVRKLSYAEATDFNQDGLPGMPGYLPLTRRVGISVSRPGLTDVTPVAMTEVPGQVSGREEWRSEGDKVDWDKASGTFTVNTEKTQGAVGFLKGKAIETKDLSAAVETEYCQVTATSLDDKSLATSGSILLVTVARAENSGQVWNSGHTRITAWGGGPILIEPVVASVTLKGIKDRFVHVLNHQGQRTGITVPTQNTAAGLTFKVGTQSTYWYEISSDQPVPSRNLGPHRTGSRAPHWWISNGGNDRPTRTSGQPYSLLDAAGRRQAPSGVIGSGGRVIVP